MEYTVVGRLDGREEIREGVRASRVPLVVEDFRRRGADVTVRIDGTDVLSVGGIDATDY